MSSKSREAGELQDMYRRTLAAYWSAQPGELKADECIEDIFAGGDGWGDREKPYSPKRTARFAGEEGSVSMSGSETAFLRVGKSHETLRPGNKASSGAGASRGERGSLEQQAHQMKAEAAMHRRGAPDEVDEFDMREDLGSWKRGM